MTFISPEKIAQRRRLLHDLSDLQLWYTAVTAQDHHRDFTEIFNAHTEIYRCSNLFSEDIAPADNTPWQTIVKQMHALWHQHRDPDSLGRLAWPLLAPYIEPRVEADIISDQQKIAASYAGFTYEFHYEYFGPAQPELLTLHFRNYFAPDSPFNHQDRLNDALLNIVEQTRLQRPDVTRVQCASWLNNIPPFYSLFPSAWIQNASRCPIEGHNGWWGQFVDRTGQLHQKHVALFKKNKTFQYPNRHCRCTIDALQKHLVKLASA